MSQLVGCLGADHPRGRVEPNGLIAARELLQHLPQIVIDPDITRMALLGGPQHRLGQRLSPAAFRPVPSKFRLIAPSSSNLAVFASACNPVSRAALSA